MFKVIQGHLGVFGGCFATKMLKMTYLCEFRVIFMIVVSIFIKQDLTPSFLGHSSCLEVMLTVILGSFWGHFGAKLLKFAYLCELYVNCHDLGVYFYQKVLQIYFWTIQNVSRSRSRSFKVILRSYFATRLLQNTYLCQKQVNFCDLGVYLSIEDFMFWSIY